MTLNIVTDEIQHPLIVPIIHVLIHWDILTNDDKWFKYAYKNQQNVYMRI